MPKYLSAAEAMAALHLPSSTFYRYVHEGKITKHYPTAVSTHGIYDSVEIARLKRQIRLEEHPPLAAETDWITPADLGHFYDLEYSVYRDETGNPATIRRWLSKNPYIVRILFNKEDRHDLWGGISMDPLPEETIFKILRGEMRDADIDPNAELLTYDEPGIYNIYIGSVIIRSERSVHFKTLIDSIFNFWCDMAPQRQIGKIYGRVMTDDGEMMAKKLFFSPLWSISDTAWVLDTGRPNPSRIVQSFQECVRDKEQISQKADN